MAKKAKSIEEQVEDWCKRQFTTTRAYTKNEAVNPEIDKALEKAPSKKGGTGKNYPDIKVLLEFADLSRIPVMIEVKGTYGDFIRLDEDGKVSYKTRKGEIEYNSVAKYAVNGAVHYARAIIDYTESYDEAIAVGVNGYDIDNGRKYEIGAYYINKNNLYVPIKIGDYGDLSFLQKEYLPQLRQRLRELTLSEEQINKAKNDLENEIDENLKFINQKMHEELKIPVGYRVKLIAGLVMAGLGVPGKVMPLHVSHLTGELGSNSHDGVKIVNKIKDYLQEKHLPSEKISMIMNELNQVFLHSRLHLPEDNGESRLHTLYSYVRSSIMPFLNGELHNIDFTGRLFNVLNDWVDVPDGDRNDVVLTPRYVTELMARLCGVNKDSYVWDFATGSAGFLISAMNQMIKDAEIKLKNQSPAELETKVLHIKMHQLLGIEKLPDIYLLAVLNMILMKDGSTNLIHGDSLKDFNGEYEQGDLKGKKFPANVFLLNPPYSAPGKGFNFVAKALGMMEHGGMAAVLIQENAGSGNGLPYTKGILEHNTLRASIHMADIFIGKSSVQTAIYVFQVGRPHNVKDIVRFIDFSNDGYSRQNRKKSSQNVNLRDTDNAEARYNEIYNLVTFGRGVDDSNLHYFRDAYVEDNITLSGKDWTYKQHQHTDPTPTYEDFYKVVSDYLVWRVGEALKNQITDGIGKIDSPRDWPQPEGGYKAFKLEKLFDVLTSKKRFDANKIVFTKFGHPYVVRTSLNNGIKGIINEDESYLNDGNTIAFGQDTATAFYQEIPYFTGDKIKILSPKHPRFSKKNAIYFVLAIRKSFQQFSWGGSSFSEKVIKSQLLQMPIKKTSVGEEIEIIDFDYIESLVRELEESRVRELEIYLKEAGLI